MDIGFIYFCLFIIVLLIFYLDKKTENHDPSFIEYDEDGYLTEESYKSHIVIRNGRAQVIGGMNTISKTRNYEKQMNAAKELRQKMEEK